MIFRSALILILPILSVSLIIQPLQSNVNPDFDGNGTLDLRDYLAFIDVFGSRQGDGTYEAKYDLNNNGEIDIPDFLILVEHLALYAESPKIYWTDSGGPSGTDQAQADKIQRADINGQNIETLLTYDNFLRYPNSIALDVDRGKMYWTDINNDVIRRADLNGQNPGAALIKTRELVTPNLVGTATSPQSIALDLVNDKMYWIDSGTQDTADGKIQRADMDGSNVEDLVTTGLTNPYGIALDVDGNKMYWTDWNTDKIQRADLDGSNVEDLVTTGLSTPRDIALDLANNKMYWTDAGNDRIKRADLNGQNIETLIETRKLVTPNLTGSETTPLGIALDVAGGKMYWTDSATDKIQRADLDGQNVEDIITTGLVNPTDIAVDVQPVAVPGTAPMAVGSIDPVMLGVDDDAVTIDVSSKFSDADGETLTYTAVSSDEAIATVSVTGSTVTISPVGAGSAMVTVTASDPGGLTATQNIDITVSMQTTISPKIYWIDGGGPAGTDQAQADKIQRADINGQNIETLLTYDNFLRYPNSIALDVDRGKMYWTDINNDVIRRADLNGQNPGAALIKTRELVTPNLAGTATSPQSIALDLVNDKMYWIDSGTQDTADGKIQRADLDGSNVEDLVTTGLTNPYGIALDVDGNKMYWTDWNTDKIQRADLDGSNVEDLVTTGLSTPRDIALDLANNKMYWTDAGNDRIKRADLDGDNVETLVETRKLVTPNLAGSETTPLGIALDVAGGKMYWTDSATDKIQRADLNGQNVEDIITTGLVNPTDIAVDVQPVAVPGTAPMAVGSIDPVMLGVDDDAVTIDVSSKFSDADGETLTFTAVSSDEAIATVSVTGSTVTISPIAEGNTMVTVTASDPGGLNATQNIDITVSMQTTISPKIYWTDSGGPSGTDQAQADKIQRADINGQNIETLLTYDNFLRYPNSIALDVDRGKMYWTDINNDVIRRADLNGQNPGAALIKTRELVTPNLVGTATSPQSIALDLVNDKMYWIDSGTQDTADGKIQRADMDGSNVEDLVTTGLTNPYGIALDVDGNKMYWTDWNTDKIQRADLDGSNVEDLITTGLSTPRDIALDLVNNKMYWTDAGNDLIKRADLDGSNVETLVETRKLVTPNLTGSETIPLGIALDLVNDKMYWTDSATDKIQRADLNGQNVEDIITTGLVNPTDIAVDVQPVAVPGTAPMAVGTIDPVMLGAGDDPMRVDVSSKFSDADGETLTFTAVSSDEAIATVSVTGSTVTISPVGAGSAMVTVTASDPGGLTATQGIAVNVQPSLTFTASTTKRALDENTPSDEKIGDPVAIKGFDSLTYSLSGTNADKFAIDASSGQIRTRKGVTYNFEQKKSYWMKVIAVDEQGSALDSIVVIITVNDVDEPPPLPPSNFLVIPGDRLLSIHFREVSNSPERPPVRGYHAEIRKGEDGAWGDRKTIYGHNNTSVHYHELKVPRYHDPYLVNGQLYQIRVRAWNSEGESDWSEPVSGIPVYVPPEPEAVSHQTKPEPFQGADNLASAETDISDITGEGGKIVIPQTALPANISREEVEGVFVEIVKVKASNVPKIPPHAGFTILGSASIFDIALKVRVNNQDIDIGNTLTEPVEICLPVPAEIANPILVRYSDGTWERLDRQRVNGNVVCAFSDQFSLFGIAVKSNRAPVSVGSISPVTLSAGDSPKAVDVSSKFSDADGDALTYTAVSSNEAIATVSVTGSTVTISPVSVGSAIVRVTASDPGGLNATQNIAITVSPQIYWTDNGTDKIQRANLNGSNVEDLVTTGLSTPPGIALDVAEDKMYWTDVGNDRIKRADLDGSNVETLIETRKLVTPNLTGSATNPQGIALDLVNDKMYWIDSGTLNTADGKIQRADLDGSNVEDLVTTGLTNPYGIALDVDGNKMYWTDWNTDKIQRADLDGSNVEDLITTGLSTPRDIALDLANNKMYWTDAGNDRIKRADLNGQNIETLIETRKLVTPNLTGSETTPLGIALNGNKMYWTDSATDKIQRANITGTIAEIKASVEDIITGLGDPTDIVVGVQPVAVPGIAPMAVGSIDPVMLGVGDAAVTIDVSSKFSDADGETLTYTAVSSDETIVTVSVTGSTVTISPVGAGSAIVTVTASDARGFTATQKIAIIVSPIYWTDNGTNKIQRADLDGSDVEDLVTTGLSTPLGIALDVAEDKMYWTDVGNDRIKRADLDGSNVETLIETRKLVTPNLTGSATNPQGIALDLVNDKMYWIDSGTLNTADGKIQRADLDGSNVEDLVTTGLTNPYGIALDVDGNKIYWTDWNTDKIQRADLDGSNVEDLITTGLITPRDIALDLGNNKMYWTDAGNDLIKRANLNGSNVETLVETRKLVTPNLAGTATTPLGIALDLGNNKMYWTDSATDKIQRADLDGQNAEDIITTGLDDPKDITVGK